MKFLVVVSCLVVVCSARPEPPSFGGYPSFGGLPPSGGAPPSGLDSYSPAPSGGGGSFGSAPSAPGARPGSEYGAPAATPTIHKHVYVHVPPPEPQEPAPKRTYPTRAPQKHYKIVFIKAPTPPTPTAPELPPVVQDEQKTLIYVLVKKPEEAPEINIPTPAPTKPSKPEVYFIRYKTKSDAAPAGYPPAGPPPGAAAFGGSAPSAPSGPSSGSAPSAPSNAYGVPGAGF